MSDLPPGTNAYTPAWAPDGARLAISLDRDSDGDIFLMNADESGLDKITDDPGTDFFPAWSPDGARITFMSDRAGDLDIYVMDADGSNIVAVSQAEGAEWFPTWSPDGTRIAWFSGEFSGGDSFFPIYMLQGDVYVANADGSDLRNVSNLDFEMMPGVNFIGLDWSPDGSQLVFGVPAVEGFTELEVVSQVYVA